MTTPKKTTRRSTKKTSDAPASDGDSGDWQAVEGGATIGGPGSEDGVMVKDEEHPSGARIAMEKEGSNAPFIVTCGIYGWMYHTRYFDQEGDANQDYAAMRKGLADIINMLPPAGETPSEKQIEDVQGAINKFVERFP